MIDTDELTELVLEYAKSDGVELPYELFHDSGDTYSLEEWCAAQSQWYTEAMPGDDMVTYAEEVYLGIVARLEDGILMEAV